MTAGPDRAAHELRNTLATARTLASFHPTEWRHTPVAPKRTCASAGCTTRLRSTKPPEDQYCDTCQTRRDTWEHHARQVIEALPKTPPRCGWCNNQIINPRWDKKYCCEPCRNKANNAKKRRIA